MHSFAVEKASNEERKGEERKFKMLKRTASMAVPEPRTGNRQS